MPFLCLRYPVAETSYMSVILIFTTESKPIFSVNAVHHRLVILNLPDCLHVFYTVSDLSCSVLHNVNHVPYHILPDRTSRAYSLRPRQHDRTLTVKSDARNFTIRQLFKDIGLLGSNCIVRVHY